MVYTVFDLDALSSMPFLPCAVECGALSRDRFMDMRLLHDDHHDAASHLEWRSAKIGKVMKSDSYVLSGPPSDSVDLELKRS